MEINKSKGGTNEKPSVDRPSELPKGQSKEGRVSEKFKVKNIRYGQVASYKDSIYEYEVISEVLESEVEKHCITEVKPCKNKSQGSSFHGSCSFPFGLNSYYKFNKVADNTYRYTVCEPYTG